MLVSNINFGNSLLLFYNFGDRCFVKRNVFCLSSRMVSPMTSFHKVIKQLCLYKMGLMPLKM